MGKNDVNSHQVIFQSVNLIIINRPPPPPSLKELVMALYAHNVVF